MNAGSVFSGIGGMDEGLRRAGIRHVFFAESDAYRRDVLRARFPGATVYDDVREVVANSSARLERDPGARADVGRVLRPLGCDLLAGGFPCQDLSVAGQRAGLAGDRSGLFFEFARVADALRPRWLLVENVPGLLSSNGGRDFGVVLGTLADLGYGLGWRVLDSRFFGVPQRRRRVFIVGAVADDDPRAASERAGQVLAVGARCPGHPATRREVREDIAGTLGGGAGERGWAQDTERMTFVANALTTDGNRFGGADQDNYVAAPLTSGSHPNSNAPGRRKEDDEVLVVPLDLRNGLRGDGATGVGTPSTGVGEAGDPAFAVGSVTQGIIGASVRRLTPTECERLQGLPDGWTQLGGTPDSKRYAALGDAVTANVSEWIGGRLMAADAYYTGAAAGGALPDPARAGARVGNET